jgi:hypothetical protein
VPDGTRLGWRETPARVRAAIQWWLGAEVVDAASQPGGFSPGLAARLRLADGRRVFVKAIGAERTPLGPSSYRAEARVTAALPPSVPAPRLLWSYDDGDWVALVLEDIDGRPPAQPWRPEELDRVLAALAALAVELTPTPVDAPAVTDKWAESCTGWRRLAAARDRRLAGPAPWAWTRLDRLAELEGGVASGRRRHDPAARRPARRQPPAHPRPGGAGGLAARLRRRRLDRPAVHAAQRRHAGTRPAAHLRPAPGRPPGRRRCGHRGAGGDRRVLVSGSLEPAPPGLPTLRGFQLAQGRAALAWLRRRLEQDS